MIFYFFGFVLLSAAIFVINKNYRTRKKQQLIGYLKNSWGKSQSVTHYNFDLIDRYFLNQIGSAAAAGCFQLISDKLAEDLYLDSVFKAIDRTTSKIGQQYLYFKIRAVDKKLGNLMKFDSLVTEFQTDEALRIKCQLSLHKLSKLGSYYFEDLIYGETTEKPKNFSLIYLLSILSICSLIAAFIYPQVLLLFFVVFALNTLLHYWNKKNLSLHLSSLVEYSNVYSTATTLHSQPLLCGFCEDPTFFLELKALNKKMRFINLISNVEDDPTSIIFLVSELFKIAFNLEVIVFYSLIGDVKAKKEALGKLFAFIGQIDSAISVASYRASAPHFCKPNFLSPKHLKVKDLIHPLIESCTPNSLTLDKQSLLLTGSNMSGKTTFIRSIAINLLLGQTIYTCLASEFNAPFSRIFSSINIADNLLNNTSYYLEEVITLKDFIDESIDTEPALFILDELFKGTNTLERIANGKAVLSSLNQNDHLVLVSTHDVELCDLLYPSFNLYHFSESIIDSELVFDHKIKEGRLRTSNAIRLLEANGYPKSIISDAYSTYDALKVKHMSVVGLTVSVENQPD